MQSTFKKTTRKGTKKQGKEGKKQKRGWKKKEVTEDKKKQEEGKHESTYKIQALQIKLIYV